jgi:hypothetical protein
MQSRLSVNLDRWRPTLGQIQIDGRSSTENNCDCDYVLIETKNVLTLFRDCRFTLQSHRHTIRYDAMRCDADPSQNEVSQWVQIPAGKLKVLEYIMPSGLQPKTDNRCTHDEITLSIRKVKYHIPFSSRGFSAGVGIVNTNACCLLLFGSLNWGNRAESTKGLWQQAPRLTQMVLPRECLMNDCAECMVTSINTWIWMTQQFSLGKIFTLFPPHDTLFSFHILDKSSFQSVGIIL